MNGLMHDMDGITTQPRNDVHPGTHYSDAPLAASSLLELHNFHSFWALSWFRFLLFAVPLYALNIFRDVVFYKVLCFLERMQLFYQGLPCPKACPRSHRSIFYSLNNAHLSSVYPCYRLSRVFQLYISSISSYGYSITRRRVAPL